MHEPHYPYTLLHGWHLQLGVLPVCIGFFVCTCMFSQHAKEPHLWLSACWSRIFTLKHPLRCILKSWQDTFLLINVYKYPANAEEIYNSTSMASLYSHITVDKLIWNATICRTNEYLFRDKHVFTPFSSNLTTVLTTALLKSDIFSNLPGKVDCFFIVLSESPENLIERSNCCFIII